MNQPEKLTVLVAGSAGQLGTELQHRPPPAGVRLVAPPEAELDILQSDSVADALAASGARVLVNAAAYTAVDRAETEKHAAYSVNHDGPAILADACAASGTALIHISTDYVFDGSKPTPYTEEDPVGAINVYGASKAAGEAAVRARCARHIVLRTSWVYSRYGNNFVKTILSLARERDELSIVGDQIGAPTSTVDIADVILSLCAHFADRPGGPWGTFHYTGGGQTSWYGFAEHIVDYQCRNTGRRPALREVTTAERPAPARRPPSSRLDCSKIAAAYDIHPVPWRDAVDRVLGQLLDEAPGAA